MLGLAPQSESGLVALYCISAIVMLIICVIGLLGACNVCYPVFIVMWLIGMAILTAVVIVQLILTGTLQCTPQVGTVDGVICNKYPGVAWAGLGVTLGVSAALS